MTLTTPVALENDRTLDRALRPKKLSEYVGQDQMKRSLGISLKAAQRRKEPLEHIMFYGPAGLGKTTIANIIASEMGAPLRATSGPALEKPGDIAAVLTNLPEGGVLFIDEIHRLGRLVEEILYPAMEDFAIDIIIGKGPTAQTLKLTVPPFTLVAATTKISALSAPLRSRFESVFLLNFYAESELAAIIERSAALLKIKASPEAIRALASRSRATPRVANRLLKRARDFAEVEAAGVLSAEVVLAAMNLLDIDHLGLEKADRRLLRVIAEKFSGGPVGLSTLAAATAEDQGTIEDIYEPFLLQLGLLARTPKGRVTTRLAYDHLKLAAPQGLNI